MKRMACLVLMILLLTGCAGGGTEPEALVSVVRGEYLSLAGWQSQVALTAHYGDAVYQCSVDVRWRREGETVLTITQPQLLAGVTARLSPDEQVLEYDGAGVSIGLMDEEGLTPVSALPVMMEQLTQGYIARCSWAEEGTQLCLVCRDPSREAGQGTEYILFLDAAAHQLVRAEVQVDGVTRLEAVFEDFTMEMTDDDTGDNADLGGG
ncbi:MAG TPA: hypothetical protein DIT49_01935 [Clostridiales bacterium]|nr:hypothetical protein [Clostridiales bacterium]